MKSSAYLIVIGLLLGAGCHMAPIAKPVVPLENITVNFPNSDHYTDVKESWGNSTSAHYLEVISRHAKEVAATLLAPGQKLVLTFEDIDLAGDFIPGRGSMDDVRIVKDIYIPRMVFTFQLSDASGVVVREGPVKLHNMNFMNEIQLHNRHELLSYDKAMLSRWLKDEFRK